MNALAPPKAKSRLCGTALRKLRRHLAYGIAGLLATALGWPFRFWEQRRDRSRGNRLFDVDSVWQFLREQMEVAK
jgi:hypothetical protein